MKQWSGLHKIQQLAHLQGIVRPCQGTAPRLPGPAIAVLSVKTPFISQLLPCADKAAVVSTGPILVRLRVVTSGEFTCHELLLAHVQRAPVPMPFCFLQIMAFLQLNPTHRLSAGNGNAAHKAPQEGTIRNFQHWETSHRKPALIILLRGEELASFSLQNRRKRKRALESHRKVNKNFLSPASFRWSWEGPLGCLSPKGCAPQCQRKQARGPGFSL